MRYVVVGAQDEDTVSVYGKAGADGLPVPFEEVEEAEAARANLAFTQEDAFPSTFTVVALAAFLADPAKRFVVKYDTETGRSSYVGTFATRETAEQAAKDLQTDEDVKPGTTPEVLDVDQAEAEALPIEGMPE